MDEMLPEEIPAIRESVRRFMESEVIPVLDDYEERRELPRDLIRKAGMAGFYGSTFPETVGGTNMGYLAAAVILEEISRLDIRMAGCSNQQGGNCPACIYLAGTPEQMRPGATHPALLKRKNHATPALAPIQDVMAATICDREVLLHNLDFRSRERCLEPHAIMAFAGLAQFPLEVVCQPYDLAIRREIPRVTRRTVLRSRFDMLPVRECPSHLSETSSVEYETCCD